MSMSDVVTEIQKAKAASIELSALPTDVKDRALGAMISALDCNRQSILEANSRDLEDAKKMLDAGEISGSMYKRLKIDGSKIDGMIDGIRNLLSLPDPVGEVMSALDLDDGLTLYQIRCPIGLLGMIFESRPDVVPQIMSLCLKSGNAVAFKGGREASASIRALFDILKGAAVGAGVPGDAFVLLETRSDINAILGLDRYIDLLIPRGSNEFVRYIQDNTRIPVLGHAAGICHVYVDSKADPDMAVSVALDSKVQYPAVCNAAETILVSSEIADAFIPRMVSEYVANGVEVRGDEKVLSLCPDAVPAAESDWDTEYGDLIVSMKVVGSLAEAMGFINAHGSHHTDAIITEDANNASAFVRGVDSADVFVNASTRFADGYRFGKGAEVGISTNKIHARGPVGMEGLMIYKYVLAGHGQVVKDYVGPGCRKFKHQRSSEEYPFRGA